MSNFSKIVLLLAVMFWAWGDIPPVAAVTPLKMERNADLATDSAVKARVKKVSAVIKAMNDSQLVLKNGKKYSLQGVRVVVSQNRRGLKTDRRLAELMFVNDRLVEVVVR